jgi:hypothetical protein
MQRCDSPYSAADLQETLTKMELTLDLCSAGAHIVER